MSSIPSNIARVPKARFLEGPAAWLGSEDGTPSGGAELELPLSSAGRMQVSKRVRLLAGIPSDGETVVRVPIRLEATGVKGLFPELDGPAEHPFVSLPWLSALETTGCATARRGWLPQHLVASVDGEATALLLAREFGARGVRVTRIASGVPHGGDLEFADQVTLGRAIEGRKSFG